MKYLWFHYYGTSHEVLSKFLASVPKLESLDIFDETSNINYENLKTFWYLPFLRSFSLYSEAYRREKTSATIILKAISVACPQLEKLEIFSSEADWRRFRDIASIQKFAFFEY